jgi:hypothetical protein
MFARAGIDISGIQKAVGLTVKVLAAALYPLTSIDSPFGLATGSKYSAYFGSKPEISW